MIQPEDCEIIYTTKCEFNYQNKSWNESESSKNYQQYYHEIVGDL